MNTTLLATSVLGRCGRNHRHGPHDVVSDVNDSGWRCPGAPTGAPSLAHLLAMRPDLEDVTAAAVQMRNQVMSA